VLQSSNTLLQVYKTLKSPPVPVTFIIFHLLPSRLTRLSGLSSPLLDDGITKGKKRKAADHVEDTEPKKRTRKPRDPNAPKRPPSSYILFQNDIRKQLKEKNPKVSNNELLAIISKQWNEMPDQDKEVYRVASTSLTLFSHTLFSITTKQWLTRKNNTPKRRKHTTLVLLRKSQPLTLQPRSRKL
jgi:HMG (high mobility group) box